MLGHLHAQHTVACLDGFYTEFTLCPISENIKSITCLEHSRQGTVVEDRVGRLGCVEPSPVPGESVLAVTAPCLVRAVPVAEVEPCVRCRVPGGVGLARFVSFPLEV